MRLDVNMHKISFTEEDRNLFTIFYNTYTMCKRTGDTIEQLDVALRVLRAIKKIADDKGELQKDGGIIELCKDEFKYLDETLKPPHTMWIHAGLEFYAQIQEKMHASHDVSGG